MYRDFSAVTYRQPGTHSCLREWEQLQLGAQASPGAARWILRRFSGRTRRAPSSTATPRIEAAWKSFLLQDPLTFRSTEGRGIRNRVRVLKNIRHEVFAQNRSSLGREQGGERERVKGEGGASRCTVFERVGGEVREEIVSRMSSTYEPAGREGEAERPGPAPAVTRQHRKMMAVVLAALGVAAIIAVAGSGESGVAYELLESTGNLDAAHNRGVLQQLLAEVERANSDTVGTDERPVELEQKAAKSLPEKPCNAACQQRKKEIAARMKALRDQINHDFKAMTSLSRPLSVHPRAGWRCGYVLSLLCLSAKEFLILYRAGICECLVLANHPTRRSHPDGRNVRSGFGHKAGYLPPPQSIKQQVMSGSLLSQSKEPVAPPPFSPTLSAKAGSSLSGTSSSDSAAAPAAAAAPSPAEGPEDSSSGDSPSLATADPPKDPPALPVAAPGTAPG